MIIILNAKENSLEIDDFILRATISLGTGFDLLKGTPGVIAYFITDHINATYKDYHQL